jgi:hypothetical protein
MPTFRGDCDMSRREQSRLNNRGQIKRIRYIMITFIPKRGVSNRVELAALWCLWNQAGSQEGSCCDSLALASSSSRIAVSKSVSSPRRLLWSYTVPTLCRRFGSLTEPRRSKSLASSLRPHPRYEHCGGHDYRERCQPC